jgi:hypothetical protein
LHLKRNTRLVDCDQLKIYKQHLTRALKTLEYINIIEFNSKVKRTSLQSIELKDLKVNIQRQVLRISKLINEFNHTKAA